MINQSFLDNECGILFICHNDWANCSGRVSRAINKFIGKKISFVLSKNKHPYGYLEDLNGDFFSEKNAITLIKHYENYKNIWIIHADCVSFLELNKVKDFLQQNTKIEKVFFGSFFIGSWYRNNKEKFDKKGNEYRDFPLVRFISPDSLTVGCDKRDFPYLQVLDDDSTLDEICESKIIKITHSPSNRAKKGTNLIDNVIHDLNKKYLFEYSIIENLNFEECKKAREGFDIFIDQYNKRVGGFGYSSVEAAAQGMVCFSTQNNIDKKLWDFYKIEKPPIKEIESSVSLYEDLEYYLKNPKKLLEDRKLSFKWASSQGYPNYYNASNYYLNILSRFML